jgi:hypothetical protein
MRRSSWSKNRNVASYFAPGFAAETGDGNSILIEALVKNRNVIPAGDMFPDVRFPAPYGQKRASVPEEEAIFGGKFKIVGYSGGKLQVETVVDGARANGGSVANGRPYLVGENGPEIFVPKSAGGIVPGYAMGGHVTGTQYFAADNEQRIVQPNAGGYMKSMIGGQLAGFGLSTLGGKMFGGAGQMGGYILGQMGVDMLLMAKNARTATSETTLLSKAFNFFVKMPGPVKLIAALLGVGLAIKAINDKINEHRRIIDSTFAPEETTITKLGLQYKTVGEQIDAFNKKQEKLNALAAAYKYSSTTATGGINLTQKELDTLKKSSAKEFPTEIKAINMASLTEAPKKIEQLKAIFVSSGLSVEKATNLIYALILNSNKAKDALDLLGTEGFGFIQDKATAAASTLKTYNDLIKEGNKDQLGKALDTSINAYQNLTKSLIGTKDTAGKVLTSSEAYAKVLDQISSKAENNVAIGLEGAKSLAEQNVELAKIVNSTDTLASLMAKVKLSTSGITLDLQNMGPAVVEALSIVVTKQEEILRSATGPFASLAKDIAAIGKTNADQIIKNATASADALKKEIDLHNKNIDRIKAEADARKNALDQQNSDENINLQIKAKQLEYQDKLASGDMSGAAQAQIAIQQLVGSQQLTLAKRAIDTKANADISKEQATIDSLNAKIEGLQNTVNKAQKTADAAAKKSSNLQALMDQLVSLTIASDAGPLSPEQQTQLSKLKKDLISASGGKYKALVDSLSPTANKIVSPAPGIEFNLGGSTGGVSSIAKDTFSAAWDASKKAIKTTDPEVLAAIGALSRGEKIPFAGIKSTPNAPIINPSATTKDVSSSSTLKEAAIVASSGKKQAQILTIDGIEYEAFIYKNARYIQPKGTSGTEVYVLGAGNVKGKRVKLAQGGLIHRYDNGGGVNGPGTGTSDSIPAYLSNGEYVVKADSVKKYGVETFDALNAQKFASGSHGGVAPLPKGYKQSKADKKLNSVIGGALDLLGVNSLSKIMSGKGGLGDYASIAAVLPMFKLAKLGKNAIQLAAKNVKEAKAWTHYAHKPAEGVQPQWNRPQDRLASYGAGTYGSLENAFEGMYGTFAHKLSLSPAAWIKTALGRGSLTDKTFATEAAAYSKLKGIKMPPSPLYLAESNQEFLQYLIKRGYTGYKTSDLTGGIVTNWMVGAKGYGLKNVFGKLPFVKPTPRILHPDGPPGLLLANGGYVNTFGMGMEGFGKTLTNAGNSVIKNILGFDLTTPFSKKSKMELLSMALLPAGGGGMGGAKIAGRGAAHAASLAYKPINLINQYRNYFKAKAMVKKGMFHGSADLGRNSDGPFNGITELGKDYSRDPYYGMGFYGTTSKAEADLYAGGYNAPGQWGESYGSLNKITKIPFGRYLDFSKNLKKQNYGLWSILGKQGFMGAGENLGSLMNKSGMTGSIMPRISAGMAPGDINAAKWIALNKPEGTKLTSNFANGGYINPSFNPSMSTPAFAMGGLAGPKYTIPNNTVSVGKPGISGYNKGGSVNHYNVGGMVINTQPGQDEKMIATMVVDMLDQKNMMRSAMIGRGRNN